MAETRGNPTKGYFSVVKVKDISRRRVKGFRGRAGSPALRTHVRPSTDVLPTKEAALEAAVAMVDQALANLDSGTLVVRQQGHLIIVSPTLHGGWSYLLPHLREGEGRIWDHSSGYKTQAEALLSARQHLADILWTFEVDDEQYLASVPEDVRGEIRSRIAWQREYRRLTRAGYDDQGAREVLGGLRKEAGA